MIPQYFGIISGVAGRLQDEWLALTGTPENPKPNNPYVQYVGVVNGYYMPAGWKNYGGAVQWYLSRMTEDELRATAQGVASAVNSDGGNIDAP